jgi:NAD+ synthase (glutamine-hydrolysing)
MKLHNNPYTSYNQTGPACWLWDYLRRSNQAGYFVPLSGGRDSASVATMLYVMCVKLFNTIQHGGNVGDKV